MQAGRVVGRYVYRRKGYSGRFLAKSEAKKMTRPRIRSGPFDQE
jgi:hypothetical protein